MVFRYHGAGRVLVILICRGPGRAPRARRDLGRAMWSAGGRELCQSEAEADQNPVTESNLNPKAVWHRPRGGASPHGMWQVWPAGELGRLRYGPAGPAPVGMRERGSSHLAMAKAGHPLTVVCVAAVGGCGRGGHRGRGRGYHPHRRLLALRLAEQRQSRTAPPSTVSTVPVTKRLSIR